MKPFLKYAGGKTQSLQYIYPLIPKKFNTYYEPFLGGGSLYFFLNPEKAVISDINRDLMVTYLVCRDNLQELIDLLRAYPNDKAFYSKMREKCVNSLSCVEVAARFIYLNKTCYNGLYRVNSKGIFNVPFGNYSNPSICDEQALKQTSQCLQNAQIYFADFATILKDARCGDFVYMDPPYVPVEKNSFVQYSQDVFDMACQERLAEEFKRLVKKDVKVLLSNSDTEWVRETYKEFNLIEIKSKRSINSKGSGRGKITELLVKGY